MVNREDLGNRVVGQICYNSDTKEFIGLTNKQVKDVLGKGDKIYGFILDSEGEIVLDENGWKISNYMVRSGINTLRPANELDESIVNVMYVVVGVKRVKGGEDVYEVINSKYARVEMPESKVRLLLELKAIQGGVYMDGKKLAVCDGVEVIEEEAAAEAK